MTKANQRKLLILLAVVFWMAIIFKLSAQPGEQSNLLSTKVTTIIVSLAKLFQPDLNVLSLNQFIRKCAHFLSSLVFGIIVRFTCGWCLARNAAETKVIHPMVCAGSAHRRWQPPPENSLAPVI